MTNEFKEQVRGVLKKVSKATGCTWPDGCKRNQRSKLERCKFCGAGPYCRVHIRTHFRQNHRKAKDL